MQAAPVTPQIVPESAVVLRTESIAILARSPVTERNAGRFTSASIEIANAADDDLRGQRCCVLCRLRRPHGGVGRHVFPTNSAFMSHLGRSHSSSTRRRFGEQLRKGTPLRAGPEIRAWSSGSLELGVVAVVAYPQEGETETKDPHVWGDVCCALCRYGSRNRNPRAGRRVYRGVGKLSQHLRSIHGRPAQRRFTESRLRARTGRSGVTRT